MDPTELTKHLPEIAKATTAVAASIPFTAIVKRMLGPAADELAEMWRDQVRLYRYERQVKCVEKAEKMAKDAGFTPQAVPPKILFPLLEGASFEEDENLHTMWAALLTNACVEGSVEVRPSYADILTQLSPPEAMLLDQIQWHVDRNLTKHFPRFPRASHSAYLVQVGTWKTVLKYYADLVGVDASVLLNHANTSSGANKARSNFRVSFENLIRLGLLREDQDRSQSRPVVLLTALGYDFTLACRSPKPKENG